METATRIAEAFHRRCGRACRDWEAGLPGWIERAEIRPRARSSLIHLRMELRHRETYEANMRRRFAAFGAETGEALADLAAGRPPRRQFLRRWRGEKPPVFDDRRRILAAALLLAVPQPPSPADRFRDTTGSAPTESGR